ncbi:MAG: hypothetical protein N3G79_07055 [Sulfolobales archaeon]|nr:hypothetical protein [Sulfolobales archaeon]
MVAWGERLTSFFESPMGRFIKGVIKISLAGFLFTVVGSLVNALPPDPVINNQTIPIKLIITLIVSFFPIAYLISALKDLGVEL